MRTILILIGLPGCGKSTYARAMLVAEPGRWKRINRDYLRMMNDGYLYRRDEQAREAFITREVELLVREALSAGFDVILDNTHLSGKARKGVHQMAAAWGGAVTVEERVLAVPLEEVLRRNAQRSGEACVPEAVIRDMAKRYMVREDGTFRQILDAVHLYDAQAMEVIQYDESLSDAVICDLDGTLALLNGRNPYDASTCADDGVNPAVEVLLNAVHDWRQQRVILMSGREDQYREQTVEFWQRHFHWDFDGLFMRATGDHRQDAVVKRELFEQHVRGRYNVSFVVDDRPQVVRMWRYDLGLTVFQLNDKEF